MEPVVSIVIPCYNGELYIEDTLTSILSQEGVEFEVIIIDDGSTDKTAEKINGFKDIRIKYFYQINAGVSRARNVGFKKTRGEFVIFFDADDIMPWNFVLSRLQKLLEERDVDFISGRVNKFDSKGFIGESIKGPDSIDLENQILMYNPDFAACPANIMLRSIFLRENGIKFNEDLSSTADRFFLLECNKYGRGRFYSDVVPLYYRVFEQSMSNHLTYKLVKDNERYYKVLKESDILGEEIRKKCLFLGYFILFGSYWKIGKYLKAVGYGLKCFIKSPIGFCEKLIN